MICKIKMSVSCCLNVTSHAGDLKQSWKKLVYTFGMYAIEKNLGYLSVLLCFILISLESSCWRMKFPCLCQCDKQAGQST